MNKTTKCLTPNCKNKPSTRGICKACYCIAYFCVSHKRATWEQLIKAEKCSDINREPEFSKTAWFTTQ